MIKKYEHILTYTYIIFIFVRTTIKYMDAKLTLKLDTEVIENAKEYAKNTNTSLSKLIENYLNAITKNKKRRRKVNPIVKSLTGIITLDEKKDYKEAYTKYLTEKYK